MEYHIILKKKEILAHATTWMEATSNRPATERQTLYGCTDGKAISGPSETEWRGLPGWEREGFGRQHWWWLHNTVGASRILRHFYFETGSCYFAHAGLELMGSSNPPVPATQEAGTTGAHHHTWLVNGLNATELCT